MRRFFFFGSSAPNAGEENGTPDNGARTKHKKTLEADEGKESSASCSTRLSRSRSRRDKRNKEEPANPKQLRRSMSFSSPARNSCLDERCFSFSGDVPCTFYDESEVSHHAKDVFPNMWSPEGNPTFREYALKTPKEYSAMENDSPRSQCCSYSAGHSPVSSPVSLRCRSTRLSNLFNKNEVLDRYIDRGHEDAMINEKQRQYSSVTSMVSNLGRPPRPQSTVPSVPKSMKETTERYPDVDLKDAFLRQIAQEDTGDNCKITTMCNAGRNYISMSDAFERESATSVEDIYEDLQDVKPPNVICPSSCPTSGEQETDDMLLQRAKEVESKFIVPCGDEYEFSMARDKQMSPNDMIQLIQQLTEDRKQLAHELSSQIKVRVAERFASKEQYKQLKKELDTRTRRLEKEKIEIQTTLEREMDRRSQDWSVKLSRFQSEEERLHERVRELAEQNVSFQREVTFLEASKSEASTKATSLEMKNSKLNDDLEKLRNEHEKLHNSSLDLHARFAEVVKERDHIQEYLKDKERENKALHKVIARLQTECNEQERTITGLRQGCKAELDKKFVECGSDKMRKLQMELLRLTGVEQKLRGETRSCHLEVESLRQENIALLNRLKGAGNGATFSSIRLDQELQARVDNLQMQGLSLLDKISQLCTKLLDLMKHKKLESESFSGNDVLTVSDYTFEYQSIKGGIESLKRSLKTINSVLNEKQNVNQKSGEIAAVDSPSREQTDDFGLKLKEEAMLSRVLKEAVLSKELDIEQLESDLASSLRIQDVMRNEIQRVQDELSCITHKAKHLELQVSKKDEAINELQQDFQESAKELAALRGTLKTVTEERDLSWKEGNQLRRNISIMQNEVVSLKKKIEALDEDILLKEGQITILQDSIEKPFDIICSPRSLREFDME
ncbi:hypothetical protein HU200_045592 [Digitaria exilis]|uniref:DUF7653 domain-containing protein n=1 Tax=Digitaria exilis TaxID=1010633 RepID=A0A835B0C3_9POAL|nr:hypothetical protein HU200_045592 [Digitaria exilis]